ncbi:RNA polymerase sigma factor [Nonomuraea sp. NPDC050328]|uniref:RNA polymerase sigma factor n=1 Tax=Nonomuraea sp. NPDC050328 TaxID=3364361 RepID=UPI0037A3664E
MDNESLVLRCRLGDRAALTELVRAWHEPVLTYVRRMLGPGRADDVTQEVWVAVVRGLPRLKDPARFAPWLFTIARRAVATRLRAEYGEASLDAGAEPPAVPDGTEAVLDRVELFDGLAALPPREREILALFYLEDLSLEDCAEICGIPLGTAKSRLHRARGLLRGQLEEKP